MDRIALGTYLQAQFAPYLQVLGLTAATDTLTGFGPTLDQVMIALGLPVASDTPDPPIPDTQAQDSLLLTQYYTYRWLLPFLAASIDVTTADQKEARSQLFKQALTYMREVANLIPPQYVVEEGDFSFGRLQLDMLEPAPWYGPSVGPWWY